MGCLEKCILTEVLNSLRHEAFMFRIVQYTFSELDHDTLSELTQFSSSDATKFGMSPRIPILVEKRYGGVRISMELQDLTEVPQNLISSILGS